MLSIVKGRYATNLFLRIHNLTSLGRQLYSDKQFLSGKNYNILILGVGSTEDRY